MIARICGAPLKIVYVVLGLALLVLGVIGLIIPVIPGILFLFAAVYVLSKVSTRVRRFSETNGTMLEMRLRLSTLGSVGIGDRIRLAALYTAGAIVDVFGRMAAWVRRR